MDKHNVRARKNFTFLDGSVRSLGQLTIAQLRKVNALLEAMAERQSKFVDVDLMSIITEIILEKEDPHIVIVGGIEDIVDVPLFNAMLEQVLGGGEKKEHTEDSVKFDDIPLSEMEALLLVEGIGGWRNLEEVENSLTLDELLLLHDALGKSKHSNYRMLASFQGINLGELDEDEGELPPEVLAKEREYKAEKARLMEESGEAPEEVADLNSAIGGGFGYQKL